MKTFQSGTSDLTINLYNPAQILWSKRDSRSMLTLNFSPLKGYLILLFMVNNLNK